MRSPLVYRSSVYLLLQDLSRVRMNLFVFNLARFPASAKRFHEIDGAHHLLAAELRLKPLA